MSRSGKVPAVSPRSRASIERHASDVARRCYPKAVAALQPIPVDRFFEFVLPKALDIETSVSADLAFGVEGEARPGIDGQKAELILAEQVFFGMTEGVGRDRFTGAHECSHAILHLPELTTRIVDSSSPRLYRRQEIPRYCDPEWQADVWAAAFLMPTEAVLAFVDKFGARSSELAEAFNVSGSAAETRIYYMRRAGVMK